MSRRSASFNNGPSNAPNCSAINCRQRSTVVSLSSRPKGCWRSSARSTWTPPSTGYALMRATTTPSSASSPGSWYDANFRRRRSLNLDVGDSRKGISLHDEQRYAIDQTPSAWADTSSCRRSSPDSSTHDRPRGGAQEAAPYCHRGLDRGQDQP